MALAFKPFQCPNCKSPFTSRDTSRQHVQKFPLILPCHHSVCDSCLTAAAKAKRNFICVSCKTVANLSSGNDSIAKLHPDLHALGLLNACKRSPLPTNSLKVKMLSSPEMLQKISPKGLRETTLKMCNHCSQMEALWQCDECQMNFCNICFDEVHKKRKSRKKHEVKKIFAELYNTVVQSGCSEHKNKSVEFYCEKDDQLTCSHCMLIGAHIGHEVKTLVDKNKSCADEMKKLLTDASDIEKRLKYTQHLLSELSVEEKVDVSDQIKQVHDHFHILHSILQAREAALISKLEQVASLQNEPFEKMVFEVSGYQKEIAAVKRDAESVIENPCLAISAPSLVKKLESFLELPCYLLPLGDSSGKNVKIDLVLDQEFEEQIKKHGSVEYTVNPRFHLVPTQDLPENYCMEIPESFVASDDDTQSVTTANTDQFSGDSLVESSVSKSGLQTAFRYQHFNRMQSEAVTVSHIRDPSCFWVQRKCDDRKLTTLSAEINRFCHSREAVHCKPSSLERGDLYLVQFSNDKKWYRGRVKRILEPGDDLQVSGKKNLWLENEKKIVSNDEQNVEIYYIDFGNSEAVPVSKLRVIQTRFLHLPPMARECSLVDVAPIGEEWSVEAIKCFNKFVHQKQVTMQIYEERNNVFFVELSQVPDASISSDVPVSVRDALVFQELAVFPSGRNVVAIPQKAGPQYLPPERLRANADISVIVSHVDSPSHLYVQQISTAAYLSALIFEMSECYSKNENALLQNIYAPRVGMVCAAQFSVDKQWYRAQVISLPGGANVEVQYVDFGNREILHHRHIRKLFDRFCKLNIQAIPCKLADITYNQEKYWSSSAKEWLTAKVSKKHLTLKSIGFDAAQNKAEIILYYAEDEFEICVNGLLVEAGFASSCGPGSSEAKRRVELPPPVPVFDKIEDPVSPYEPPKEEVEEEELAPPVPPVSSQPLPTLVKKFPETEGHNIEVHVSHVISPSLFYVRIAGDMEKKLEKLMQEMQETYNGFESAAIDCKVGVAYAVYSDISKQWYRASVLSAVQDDKVKVQFVDYGKEEDIPVKNVQKLLEPFTADEEYSVCCELTGIIPAGGSSQWSFAACDAFQELVAQHDVLHLSIKEEIQKEVKSQKVLPASLFVEEIHLGGALEPTEVIYKNIASELVSRGLALPIRGGSLKPEKSTKTDKSASLSDTFPKSESPQLKSPVKVVQEPEPVPEIQWRPIVHPQEPKFKGFVTNIGEDGCIQLHVWQEGSSVVEMIKKALQFKYSKSSSERIVRPPPIGSACIAKFSMDSMWYRAEVIATYPDKVKVNFVDYGNNEIVSLNDIRLDIILHTFPKQCMDCAIAGIYADASGHWDNDLLNFLHSQLVETIVTVEPVAPPDEKGKLLCHIVASCGISIDELLQSMGFAGTSSEETDTTRSFKPATELREGDIFPVCITHVNSANIVYLQRLKILEPKSDSEKEYNKEHDAFLDLIKELQDKAESFPVLKEPLPGMACCAKFSYDDNWYRCEVTDLEKDSAIVLYVDYGNAETTSLKE